MASKRLERNTFQVQATTLVVTYRMKLEALYAPDAAPVTTLPRLTPVQGSTPDPVGLTAGGAPEENRAEPSWSASKDPDLPSYPIRFVPGPDHTAEDEAPLATNPSGSPPRLSHRCRPHRTPAPTKSTSASPPATKQAAKPTPSSTPPKILP